MTNIYKTRYLQYIQQCHASLKYLVVRCCMGSRHFNSEAMKRILNQLEKFLFDMRGKKNFKNQK